MRIPTSYSTTPVTSPQAGIRPVASLPHSEFRGLNSSNCRSKFWCPSPDLSHRNWQKYKSLRCLSPGGSCQFCTALWSHGHTSGTDCFLHFFFTYQEYSLKLNANTNKMLIIERHNFLICVPLVVFASEHFRGPSIRCIATVWLHSSHS